MQTHDMSKKMITWHKFETQSAMAGSIAAALAKALQAGIEKNGQGLIALSGGGTPVPAYQQLAKTPLAWDRVTVTLVDDRCVPEDHEASNVRLLRENLFVKEAARATYLPLEDDERFRTLPAFDAVLLGMGNDAHTASLFPRVAGLKEALDIDNPQAIYHITPDPLPPEAPFARVTLSVSRLIRSRSIIIAITGEKKRQLVEEAIATLDAMNKPISAFLHLTTPPVIVYWSP